MPRRIWGVTSPTKPMVPPSDTHTPMSTLMQMSTSSLTRRTFTPMLRALSSPTEKALSSSASCSRIPPQITSGTMTSSALR